MIYARTARITRQVDLTKDLIDAIGYLAQAPEPNMLIMGDIEKFVGQFVFEKSDPNAAMIERDGYTPPIEHKKAYAYYTQSAPPELAWTKNIFAEPADYQTGRIHLK